MHGRIIDDIALGALSDECALEGRVQVGNVGQSTNSSHVEKTPRAARLSKKTRTIAIEPMDEHPQHI